MLKTIKIVIIFYIIWRLYVHETHKGLFQNHFIKSNNDAELLFSLSRVKIKLTQLNQLKFKNLGREVGFRVTTVGETKTTKRRQFLMKK